MIRKLINRFLSYWYFIRNINMYGKLNLDRDLYDDRDLLLESIEVNHEKFFLEDYYKDSFDEIIEDQLKIGSCGPHAGTAATEICMKLDGTYLPEFELSKLALYYMTRQKMNTLPRDSGVYLRDMLKVMNTEGMIPESIYPYKISKFNDEIPYYELSFAKLFKIDKYERCYDIDTVKSALINKKPVIFGLKLYTNFQNLIGGSVPEPNGNYWGGHAMVIKGFDDKKQSFWIRNSWGNTWGINGHAWLPYSIFEKNLLDAWAITKGGKND